MKPKRLSSKQFHAIYSRVPRLCVDIVIKTRNGILLSKRDIPPAKGKWHIPGGTVLWGESLFDAVRRVAEEELGVRVRVERLLDVLEYSRANAVGQSVSVDYLCTIVSGTIRGSHQASDIRFFKSIPRNTVPEQRAFLSKQFHMRVRRAL